jgi:hypothetical protein
MPFVYSGATFCQKSGRSNRENVHYIEVDEIIDDFEYYGLHCKNGGEQFWTWYGSAGVPLYSNDKSRVDNRFGVSAKFFSSDSYRAIRSDNYDEAKKKRR